MKDSWKTTQSQDQKSAHFSVGGERAKVYTKQQLADWEAYEHVRQDGSFNMFDPRARYATGLSKDRYSFVLQNYSELKAAKATS